jgi:hypothetical protein
MSRISISATLAMTDDTILRFPSCRSRHACRRPQAARSPALMIHGCQGSSEAMMSEHREV